MRYLQITIFLFLLQCSFSIVNATGLFYEQVQPQSEWLSDLDQDQLADAGYAQSQVTSESSDFGFGDFIKGFYYFVLAVGKGVLSVPYTMGQLGLRAPFVYYFSIPVYFLYFLAIAQYIANRGARSMS